MMTMNDEKKTPNQIKASLLSLKERDLYSLSLFSLYKLHNIKEYSSLSELPYVLDKTNLINLCEFFGGQTITIPTIDELQDLVYALLLYQYVKIEGKDYKESLELIGHDTHDLRHVKSIYYKLLEVLDKYTFDLRGE